jgi:hypothetical protein
MKLYWHIWQLLTIPGLRLGLLTALAILTLWQAAADSSGVWQQYRQQQAELATFAQWPEVKSDLQGKINHLRRENASAGAEIFALFDANSYFAEKLRLCQEKRAADSGLSAGRRGPCKPIALLFFSETAVYRGSRISY